MNKHLLYSAMLVAAISANEAKAQQVSAPVLPEPAQLNLDGKDTVYVYNVKAQLWLNAGNAWGTQASLCAKGMGVVFVPNGNGTYTIVNNSNGKWERKMFLNSTDDDGGTSYVDYNNQGKDRCNWEIYLNNDKTFELQADTIANIASTSNTRAGWNPDDPKIIKGTEAASDEIFRPALDMKATDHSKFGVTWKAFTKEAYDSYNYRLNDLMPAINEAAEAGANVDKAIKAYNNSSATLEELKEACQYAKDMKRNKEMEGANKDNVKDITSSIINANCDNISGWTREGKYDKDGNKDSGGHGTNWGTHSTNYTATDGHETTQFIERWINRNSYADENDQEVQKTNEGHLSDGVLSQKVTNLPAGGYKLTCYALACQQGKQEIDPTYRVEGVTFFAESNGKEKAVKVATQPKIPQKYQLFVTLKEGADLTLGMKLQNTTANWIFIDDITLEYYGSDDTFMALQAVQEKAQNAASDVGEYSCNEDYQNAVYALQEKAEGLSESASQEEIDQLMVDIDKAMDAATENRQLYEKLASLQEELDILTSNSKYDSSELVAAMGDCGNGASYADLLDSYSLKTPELTEYINKLKELMESTRKSAIKVGADVTADMLTNPSFESMTGWNNTNGAHNSNWENCEAYQSTFNVYQEVTDIPNGVYEITVQAMHRIASNEVASAEYPNDANEITAYLYGNDITTKFASPYSAGMSEQKVTSGSADYAYNSKWIPNSMEGFKYACEEDANNYLTKVVALVTDGKLRVGVKEEARPEGRSSDWAIWDNFKITYKGTDSEALTACAKPLINEAKELQNSKLNGNVKNALTATINAVETGATMDNIAALNTAVGNARTSVKAYKPLVAAIENAKTRYEENEKNNSTSDAAKAIYNAGLKAAEDVCNNGTVADEEVGNAIKALNGSFIKYFINDELAKVGNGQKVDISKAISNYDFATMDGTSWTIKTKQNKAKYDQTDKVKAVEFYDAKAFDIYQEIVGLPAGTYELSARAFFRNTSDSDPVESYVYFATSKEEGAEPSYKQDLKSVYEGAIYESDLGKVNLTGTSGLSEYNGTYVPNNMATAQNYMVSEEVGPKYDSEVITFNYDGNSPFFIGVASDTETGNEWTLIKQFNLKCVNVVNGIEQINGEKAGDVVSTKIYDINGIQLGALKKGVNIVKTTMSDGSVKVKKVVVK